MVETHGCTSPPGVFASRMFAKLIKFISLIVKVSRVSVALASKQARSYVLAKIFLTLFYSLEFEQNLEKLL